MRQLKSLNSIKKQNNFSEKEIKLIEKAYTFAQNAHKEQSIDTKGKMPFFNHPAYAGYFLAKWKQSAEAVSAGLLHDVVEDCGVKLPEVRKKFGNKVAFYVEGMSWFRRKINGVWKKDYDGYHKKFLDYVKQDPVMAIVKASDEMSKLPPKNRERFIKALEERNIWGKYQLMVNDRLRAFWIPFFNEIEFNKVVRRIKQRGRFVKEENVKIKLYDFISEKEMKTIKTKLQKIKGIESLRR